MLGYPNSEIPIPNFPCGLNIIMVVLVGTIVVLVARELIEGAMFITSHVGAVMRVPSLSFDEKMHYLKAMTCGILSGALLGTMVSLAVGSIVLKLQFMTMKKLIMALKAVRQLRNK